MAATARAVGDRWDAAALGTLLLFQCRQVQGYNDRIEMLHKRMREEKAEAQGTQGQARGIRQGSCVLVNDCRSATRSNARTGPVSRFRALGDRGDPRGSGNGRVCLSR
jgi:hypothetical protein